jgi:hypothetical protein
VDKVRSLVTSYAQACLADLLEVGAVPRTEAAMQTGAGWTVLAVVLPTPPGQDRPGLTVCDRDCLELLASSTVTLSAARVRNELEQRGIGIYGLITVKRSLQKMKRLGILGNSRKVVRGYYLLEDVPLFRNMIPT